MSFSKDVLRRDELAIYELRELYKKYGYTQYKVSRFEEYDLYARNKRFLVSENILSFTDTNGKLMALKPDVTLSIIKNVSPEDRATHKLYYNETVYRTSAESHGFKEIMQTGLECIGTIDTYAQSEVVTLALKSLERISGEHILDISHMGLIEGLLDSFGADEAFRAEMFDLVKSKNVSAINKKCNAIDIDDSAREKICALTQMYKPLSEAIDEIQAMAENQKMLDAVAELKSIANVLSICGSEKNVYFDFSIVNDCNYYDGIIFKGFIKGIPDSVLSGGRYDRLLEKMGKKTQAIGFAVYIDRLERFGYYEQSFDIDVLLIYDETSDTKMIIDTVKLLNESGKTVKTSLVSDGSIRYRQLLKIGKGGIEILETND